MVKQAIILAGLLCLVLVLAACGSSGQAPSGQGYLGSFQPQVARETQAFMDPDLRAASNAEPALTFPARIGLARLEDGTLSPMPQIEAEAWLEMAKDLGPGWGEFVPISPMMVALGDPSTGSGDDCGERSNWNNSPCDPPAIASTVRHIRQGAARQHVDAVLIYEVFANDAQGSDWPAGTNSALLGFLPAPRGTIETEGHSQGLLVDVANGYTYGFVSAVADDAAAVQLTSNAGGTAASSADQAARTAAVTEIAGKARDMFRDLRLRLAERRIARVEMQAR
jgi:hypothetical protein